MSFTQFFRRRVETRIRRVRSRPYIAIETDENIARGMAPEAAHEAAIRKFGNPDPCARGRLLMNTIRSIDTLWQDLRFAVRLLRRDKGFALAAVVSLALGIGANTAIFQLLDAVRLRTLPVERPDELVEVRFQPAPLAPAASTAAGRC